MAETGSAAAAEAPSLEFTPTWIVAGVCSVIVCISYFFERGLHRLGKVLKHKDQKPLFEALQKVKEELMLLGFISLLLTVFQGLIQKICVPESLTRHMLPCSLEEKLNSETTAHYTVAHIGGVFGGARRRLASGGDNGYCMNKGKVPLLSVEAIHQLHIFIFVLAVTHVVCSLITVIFGGMQIHGWKHWEDEIQNAGANTAPPKISHVQQFEFIRSRFKGFGKDSFILSWMHSFFKQFYGSVSKSDYTTMRLGFIMTHCKGNPKFNFHKYMIRALEADFKKVVGISWYLWAFVMVFLLLNVNGWHTYFWISFLPLVMLLAVGAKLEHIITQLAHEVAEKHSAIEGDLVVTPSDDLFWFHQPRIVLYLIHFILFQNAFEIAYFFWILTAYGFDSCIMDKVGYIVTRLAISVIVQVLCSYSILPLYAIVTQMGSTFKKAIFDEHVQEGLVDWAQKIKRKGKRMVNGQNISNATEPRENPVGIQLQNVVAQMEQEITESGKPRASASTIPLLHPSKQH